MRPDSELTFGRNADLSLDPDNTYLHRRAGRFRLDNGIWWVENTGSRLRIKVVSSDGAVVDLHAGASSPILGKTGIVSISAGPTRYELSYFLEDEPKKVRSPTVEGIDIGIDTVTYGTKLTPREIDFVVSLAQGRLSGRGGPMATHTEIAEVWGVSPKTVDNTLQRLRAKLRDKNVRFIDSSENLVEYLVSQGLVTMHDLEWAALGEHEGPRPAADRSS